MNLARTYVLGVLDSVSRAQVDDVELLVSELVTNAVRHSRASPQAGLPEPLVVVSVNVSATGVRVEVHDRDPVHPLPVENPEDLEHGWGLQLVQRLSSSWGSRTALDGQGKAVWFEIDWPTRTLPSGEPPLEQTAAP